MMTLRGMEMGVTLSAKDNFIGALLYSHSFMEFLWDSLLIYKSF